MSSLDHVHGTHIVNLPFLLQVKVWFQNRRTKHKRMKAEEEGGEPTSRDDGQEMTSPYSESHEESDISDIDDYEEADRYHSHSSHMYQQQLQSC